VSLYRTALHANTRARILLLNIILEHFFVFPIVYCSFVVHEATCRNTVHARSYGKFWAFGLARGGYAVEIRSRPMFSAGSGS